MSELGDLEEYLRAGERKFGRLTTGQRELSGRVGELESTTAGLEKKTIELEKHAGSADRWAKTFENQIEVFRQAVNGKCDEMIKQVRDALREMREESNGKG